MRFELFRTFRQTLDVTQSPFGEACGLDIGKQTQGALASGHAGARRRFMIFRQRGVIGEIRCQRAVALAGLAEASRDMPVHKLSARLRNATIGRLPHQVMREVINFPGRPHEPATLQFAKGDNKLDIVKTRRACEIVRRESATPCGGP